ncbi:hypothetical protein B0H13DRAFT_1964126 [Mycena leptocephala]|nr:hypothetical protein B0H13DRAFT_1964126 [Mycena leptocephala]
MLSTALFFALLSSGVLAQNNDWTKPCIEGECFYDLPESSGVSGTMRVWGSATKISDITTAAGWTILNCDPSALQQDIRLVCTGDSATCGHLFQDGAVNTLVRLPQNCGANAFARVGRSWVPEDQSVPANVARQLSRRQDAPVVQALALDTDFAAAGGDPADPVNIAIAGTNVPGQTGNLTVTPPAPAPQRRSRLQRRGLFSFIENAFKKFNSFDKSVTKSLPRPLDLDKQLPVFSQSITCPDLSASVSVNVDAKAHAVVSLGMSAVGTIIPPKMSAFGVFAGLDADLTGTLTFAGTASGSIDSGLIPVFETGIPGLDFPGLLTIGPTFKIGVQGTASLDIQAQATLTLDYKVEGMKAFFPAADSVSSGGGFTPGDSPLSLSVAPSVSSKAVLAGHVIPSLDLGVSALGGVAQATISVQLDGSVTATMSLEAAATAGVSTTDPASASGSVNGCVDIGAGIDVNVGASADFFGLFDPSTKVNVFTKKFDLFKKCLGTGATRRNVAREIITIESSLTRRADLGCPAALAKLVSAVDEPVVASSIKAL